MFFRRGRLRRECWASRDSSPYIRSSSLAANGCSARGSGTGGTSCSAIGESAAFAGEPPTGDNVYTDIYGGEEKATYIDTLPRGRSRGRGSY